jgi:hypothetical protein
MKCFLKMNSLPSSRISIDDYHKLTLDILLRFLPSLSEVSVHNVGLYAVKVKNIVVQVTVRQDTPTLMLSTEVYKKDIDDTDSIPPEQRRRYNNSLLTAMMRSNTMLNRSRNLEKIFQKDTSFIYFLHINEISLHDQDKVHRLLEDFLLTRAELHRHFHQVDRSFLKCLKG